MRVVKCYECRKLYNYDEDGFCPKCGAFNQPPAASRIGADGSVVWIEGINSRNHEGSFVHKELHAENRKRKGTALEREEKRTAAVKRSSSKVIRQPLAQRDGTPTIMPKRQTERKQKGISPIFWTIVGLFLLNLLSRL